jgi:hypothetical protein
MHFCTQSMLMHQSPPSMAFDQCACSSSSTCCEFSFPIASDILKSNGFILKGKKSVFPPFCVYSSQD